MLYFHTKCTQPVTVEINKEIERLDGTADRCALKALAPVPSIPLIHNRHGALVRYLVNGSLRDGNA